MYDWIIVADIHRLKKALLECNEPHKRQELVSILEGKYLHLEHDLLDASWPGGDVESGNEVGP